MGRIKQGSQGLYYDAADSGPDQGSADDINKFKQANPQYGGSAAAPMASGGGGGESPLIEYAASQPTASDTKQDGLSGWGGESLPGLVDKWKGQVAGATQSNNAPLTDAARREAINGAYVTLLGRQANEDDLRRWWGNDNFAAEIQNSPEAKAYATGQPFSPSYANVEGADMAKLNDPTHTTPKYVALRVMASGGNIEQAAAAIGAKVIDTDKIQLQDGTIIDLYRDQEGDNALQWTVTGESYEDQAKRAAAGNTSGGGGGSPLLNTPLPSSGGSGPYVPSPQGSGGGIPAGASQQLWDFLMNRMNQNATGRTAEYGRMMDTVAGQTANTRREYLGEIAERSGPYATGYVQGQQRLSAEGAGRTNASFATQIQLSELAAQRAEIQNALSGALGLLSQEKQMQLQQQLAQIEAQLRWAQMQQDAFEFDSSDEFRRSPLAS